ncbi:uncharacterized protein LOC135134629 [Zophobas morio]|uniref:uncharacterized protein LOC135134629 n=1 Tax=Zophobas morio TaxID=2755281 RepID=UPI0030834191
MFSGITVVSVTRRENANSHVNTKKTGTAVVEATGRPPNKCRLFVTDRDSKTEFLVDTGADVCVFPKKLVYGPRKSDEYKLFSVTGTPFCTYGLVTLSLNLGLRREFRWTFIIADVDYAIIGADFLHHFNLPVDIRNGCLTDPLTKISMNGQVCSVEVPTIKTLVNDPRNKFLKVRPQVTRDGQKAKTVHFIKTTEGPPVTSRPRRLPPGKYSAAKKEFEGMVKEGIARPSKSNWSSPLHVVPKKDGDLRP